MFTDPNLYIIKYPRGSKSILQIYIYETSIGGFLLDIFSLIDGPMDGLMDNINLTGAIYIRVSRSRDPNPV